MKLEQLDLPKGSHLPIDEHIELMDALRRLDEKLGKGTYIHNPEDPIRSLESFANGGITDINAMTAPLGYKTGGPAGMTGSERQNIEFSKIIKEMEGSKGPGEQGTISKAVYKLAGDPGIDPIWKAKEKIKDFGRTGIETLKGLGSGAMGVAQELLGAGPLEASELSPEIELELLKTQLQALQGLPGSTLMPSSNQDQIKRLEDRIIEIYTQLGE